VWNVARQEVVATLRGNAETVKAVAFCPDGLHIATGGDDRKTRVWSIVTEELRADLGGERYSITGVTWSPSGGQLAALESYGSVRLWDVRGGRLIQPSVLEAFFRRLLFLERDEYRYKPTRLAFSPDGRLLAVPRGERVRLLDVERWSEVAVLQGHAGQVTAAAFSPDGSLVATASEDGTARLWGAASVQL
jgi:WD40 repeat protein